MLRSGKKGPLPLYPLFYFLNRSCAQDSNLQTLSALRGIEELLKALYPVVTVILPPDTPDEECSRMYCAPKPYPSDSGPYVAELF